MLLNEYKGRFKCSKNFSFVNKAKYENDIEYKNIADIVSNAVMNCSYLPIPKNKFKLFKNFIMDFDPKFMMEK